MQFRFSVDVVHLSWMKMRPAVTNCSTCGSKVHGDQGYCNALRLHRRPQVLLDVGSVFVLAVYIPYSLLTL